MTQYYWKTDVSDQIVEVMTMDITPDANRDQSLESFELEIANKKEQLEKKYKGEHYVFFESEIEYREVDSWGKYVKRLGVLERMWKPNT